jgi:hypothetical protein
MRPDAKIGPEEDFAVNVDSYLFQREKLKKTVPNAYAWIKNHFGDKFVVSGDSDAREKNMTSQFIPVQMNAKWNRFHFIGQG